MKKHLKELITHPLFSGSTLMVIGSNSVSFINYLYHLMMGRMLGPVSYGELAALFSVISLLGVVPASVSLVIIKYISSTKETAELNNLVNWLKSKILKASLIFFVLVLLFSPLISSFLNISKLSYMFFIALSFLFSLQVMVNRSILQGLIKFKELVVSILAENSLKLLLSIILVYLGFKVDGVMFVLIISTLLGWYITNHYLKIRLSKHTYLAPSNIKPMLFFIIPVTIQSIATTSLYSSDVILVKHFFSSYDAGIYAALSTLGKIILFGAGPISAVMFPLISQKKAQGQKYRNIFIYSFLATLLLIIVILLIYWLYPQLAIQLLYGKAYTEAADLLVWVGGFIGLFTLSLLVITYHLSLGRTSVVVLPLLAAIMQIIMVILFHQTLFMVILISIVISALLLVSLSIYSTIYVKQTRI